MKLVCTALIAVSLSGCTTDTGERYSVANSGQGSVTLEKRQVELPARTAAAPVGPTTREAEMQKRIDALEAQSKGLREQSEQLEAEVKRLKEQN